MRDWTALFRAGAVHGEPGFDSAPRSEDSDSPPAANEPATDLLVHETEVSRAESTSNHFQLSWRSPSNNLAPSQLDEYLDRTGDWAQSTLATAVMPEAASEGPCEITAMQPEPQESGCALTGRMVLELIIQCESRPAPSSGAALPAALVKVAVLGRPFSGKSLQAQRLAEAHRLLVIIPQEIHTTHPRTRTVPLRSAFFLFASARTILVSSWLPRRT